MQGMALQASTQQSNTVAGAPCTDVEHQRLKDDPEAFAWGTVAIGWQRLPGGGRLPLANCLACSSTLVPSFYRERPLPSFAGRPGDPDQAYDDWKVDAPEREADAARRELHALAAEQELRESGRLLAQVREERHQLEAEYERTSSWWLRPGPWGEEEREPPPSPRPGSVGHITKCLAEEESL